MPLADGCADVLRIDRNARRSTAARSPADVCYSASTLKVDAERALGSSGRRRARRGPRSASSWR
ncbi:hypothetical protein DI005_20815 [Prauserella sp. PE36]|nr:hypothetical protein DI005_20815 [Prauserella sp. PE36]